MEFGQNVDTDLARPATSAEVRRILWLPPLPPAPSMELCRVLDIIFASVQGWVGASSG